MIVNASDIVNTAGAIPAYSALAIAMRGDGLPRGLHFNEGAEEGGDLGEGEGGAGDNDLGDDDDGGKKDDDTIRKMDAILRELREERSKRKELERRMKETALPENELEEYRKFKADQARLEEEAKKKQGKYEELLAQQQRKYEAQIAEHEAAFNQLQSRYRQEQVDATLARHIPTYTTIPVADVAALLRPFFTFNEDGELTIQVNGEEPLNERGNPMTPEEFIADFIGKREWLAKAAPKSGSGGQTGKGGSGKGRRFTPEEILAMPHEEFIKNEAAILAQAQGR